MITALSQANKLFIVLVHQQSEIYLLKYKLQLTCIYFTDTDNLYCGDAGDHDAEEINWIKTGKNYGWNIFEGDSTAIPGENETIGMYRAEFQIIVQFICFQQLVWFK